jgi:hypothetical protein
MIPEDDFIPAFGAVGVRHVIECGIENNEVGPIDITMHDPKSKDGAVHVSDAIRHASGERLQAQQQWQRQRQRTSRAEPRHFSVISSARARSV